MRAEQNCTSNGPQHYLTNLVAAAWAMCSRRTGRSRRDLSFSRSRSHHPDRTSGNAPLVAEPPHLTLRCAVNSEAA